MLESRNHIKDRMLKNVARIWGYRETEAENNFDPLVSMLLNACAIELEKVSGEIQNSRARVLERLVQLLSPDVLTGALPAHTVVTTTPIENKLQVKEDDQYYFTKKVTAATETDESLQKDIYFSPTADFSLSRAAIRFMAVGNQLFSISNGINKELVLQSDSGKPLPSSSLWLAIDEPGTGLNNCQFYFDLRNEANRQLFYHQLPQAQWYWNDRVIGHAPGYGNRSISGEQLDLSVVMNREDDTSGRLRRQVNAYYKPYFVTLVDEKKLTESRDNEMLSTMIAEAFPEKQGEKFLQKYPVRWICIDFPKTVTNEVLRELLCVMNCFPVFNRRVHSLTYRLQQVVNIIPLNTEDIFLDLEQVSTDDGKIINSRNFQAAENEVTSILMRNGGVGRFDERDATSLVDHIIQLLRDETAAFSTLGNDFMNNELRQLQQTINKLEQRLFSKDTERGQIPYLIVQNNGKVQWQNIFIRYWSTTGAFANNIKSGNIIRLYRGSGLENNQLVVVSASVGGRDKLSTTESILAYKSALLSKDRLISREDIKAFCHYQLGSKVKSIEVEKGVMTHPGRRHGFVKTIDVSIEIHRKDFDEMQEKGEIIFWNDNLKMLLEAKSISYLSFRIQLKRVA